MSFKTVRASLGAMPGFSRRSLLAAVGGLVGFRAFAQPAATPVILGQVQLSFYAVTGGVVHEVLERLGHTVELREGTHEKIFPLLGEGAIDLMAAAWLPEGHADYWARYGRDSVEVSQLYGGAHFFLGVPEYVGEGEVGSIVDLAKPEVTRKMTRLIQGIGSGATITTITQKALVEYGLVAVGYSLRPGTSAEWIEAYDRAVAEQRWIVFPTWMPQYLNRDGRIRPLKDPLHVLGGINHASLVAPRQRFAALPARSRTVLSRIRLTSQAVTEMDWMVNVKLITPRQAAQAWMSSHRSDVDRWFEASERQPLRAP